MAKQKRARPRPTKAAPLTPRFSTPTPTPRIDTRPKPKPSAPTPTPAPAPPRDATSTVRTRGEQLIARLLELDHKVDADFYAIGKVLAELSTPAVYKTLGYTSLNQLLDKRDLPKRNQAHRLVAIANHFDATTARRLGTERAYNLIAYTKLAYPTQTVASIVTRDPKVRVGGTVYSLSTLPSRLFRNLLRDKRKEQLPRAPSRMNRTARSLSQHLHHAGIEGAHVKSHDRGYITIRLTLEAANQLNAFLDR